LSYASFCDFGITSLNAIHHSPASMSLQHQFYDRIAQLVHTFPEDAVTSTGALFWSAPKRFPQPIKFDAGDKAHVTLCRAAAILKAVACGIPLPDWHTSPEKVVLGFMHRCPILVVDCSGPPGF